MLTLFRKMKKHLGGMDYTTHLNMNMGVARKSLQQYMRTKDNYQLLMFFFHFIHALLPMEETDHKNWLD